MKKMLNVSLFLAAAVSCLSINAMRLPKLRVVNYSDEGCLILTTVPKEIKDPNPLDFMDLGVHLAGASENPHRNNHRIDLNDVCILKTQTRRGIYTLRPDLKFERPIIKLSFPEEKDIEKPWEVFLLELVINKYGTIKLRE